MHRSFLLVLPILLILVAACGSGDATPRPPKSDATPDADTIRDIDVTADTTAQSLLAKLGSGRIAAEAVVYADLTGDGRDEAVVPITSDGTLGNIGYVVLTLMSGRSTAILTRTVDRTTAGGLVMAIENGTLVETVGVFGPSDPLCCPSELRKTTFHWDGKVLQVQREVTEKNPAGPKS